MERVRGTLLNDPIGHTLHSDVVLQVLLNGSQWNIGGFLFPDVWYQGCAFIRVATCQMWRLQEMLTPVWNPREEEKGPVSCSWSLPG